MPVPDLASLLSRFHPNQDVESKIGFFKTLVPWVAPQAYLHIIYKPLPAQKAAAAAESLDIPSVLVEFYRAYNGAILFSSALSIYGIHPPGTLLERDDRFLVLPFNLELESQSWAPHDSKRFLKFGGYSWDGTAVCMDRGDNTILAFRRGKVSLQREALAHWDNLEHWLTGEIHRLSVLCDQSGKLLVDESQTVPGPILRPSYKGPLISRSL